MKKIRVTYLTAMIIFGVAMMIAAAFDNLRLSNIFFYFMFFTVGLSFVVNSKAEEKWRRFSFTVGMIIMIYAAVRLAFLFFA